MLMLNLKYEIVFIQRKISTKVGKITTPQTVSITASLDLDVPNSDRKLRFPGRQGALPKVAVEASCLPCKRQVEGGFRTNKNRKKTDIRTPFVRKKAHQEAVTGSIQFMAQWLCVFFSQKHLDERDQN